MKRLTVKRVLDHVIKYKSRIFLDLDQQLLVYLRDKKNVKKSKIVNVIQRGYFLLSRRKKLQRPLVL